MDEPQRVWSLGKVGDTVVVTFRGAVNGPDGEASAAAMLTAFEEQPVHIVFDASDVTYEPGARRAWQNVMWPHRSRILSIGICSNSSVAKMGAFLFAAFLRVGHRVVSEEEMASLRDRSIPVA